MVEVGWVESHEMPASRELRSLADILAAPPSTREQRDIERAERVEAEERSGRAQLHADAVETEMFLHRLRGTTPKSVLDQALHEPFRDNQAAIRRRAAIDALRPLGLSDVITGGFDSGVILDANVGVVEPVRDERAVAQMNQDYEFERSQRAAEERTRAVAQFKTKLDERWRARGLSSPRASHRAATSNSGRERPSYRSAAAMTPPLHVGGDDCCLYGSSDGLAHDQCWPSQPFADRARSNAALSESAMRADSSRYNQGRPVSVR